jgi:hypothetical protein
VPVTSRAGIEIVEVFPAGRRDRAAFTDLPFELATAHGPWQPGIRSLQEDLIHPGRNPFWKRRNGSFFLATRGGRTVGRMAVVDPGCVPGCPDAAVLAFPDFVDDPDVSARLFASVEERSRQRGARRILGPMNPDIHHDVGIQIAGHDRRNAVFMGYQPAYYRRHFEGLAGFQRLADFDAWALDRDAFLAGGKLHHLAQRVERRLPLVIRPVDLGRFQDELGLFHRLYAGAFADHWGFSAPTREEFQFIAGDLRYILRSRMALIAELAGEPAAFVLGVPDLYAIIPKRTRGRLTPGFLVETLLRWRRMDEARVMIAGVLPRFRHHGIHLPLFHRVAQEIFAMGFRGGEISWVMADNRSMVRTLPLLGAFVAKTYRLYIKPLRQ